MVYYKVPEKLHGKEVLLPNGERYPLEEEELLTPRECKKLGLPVKQLDQIEVSRKKIYFFFGKRFEATLN